MWLAKIKPWRKFPYFKIQALSASHFSAVQVSHPISVVLPEPAKVHNVELLDTTNKAHWTRCIHKLCTVDCNVDAALYLLNQLSLCGIRPDSLTISSIIHALCAANRFMEAHHRLRLFVSSHNAPDERTCNILIARLLDGCNPLSTLRLINSLIEEKPDFVPALKNYNRLVDGLCKMGQMEAAHLMLYHMMMRGHYPNVVSYTTLINGYCNVGNAVDAEKVFEEMSERGVTANALTYGALISGFFSRRDFQKGKLLVGKVWEVMRGEEDVRVNNAAFCSIINSLCSEGLFHEVFKIAEDMPQGNHVLEEFAYAEMIDSCCRFARYNSAARIIYIMRKKGLNPSLISYNSTVHGLCKDRDFLRAFQLLEEGITLGYFPSLYTYAILVEGLCFEHDLAKAKDVLNVMLRKDGVDRTRIYNFYLRALCHTNNPTELLNTLALMFQSQCQPDIVSLNTVVKGFCKMRRVEEALQVVDDMAEGKLCGPDEVTYTTIINGLLNVGKAAEALGFLRNVMPQRGFSPGTITYNAALRGLFKLGLPNEAMEVFNEMARDGVSGDCVTHSIVIDGMVQFYPVEEAHKFWNDVVWASGIHDSFVYSAMLRGLCHRDKFDEAVDLLHRLGESGVHLNSVNYNIVLDYACRLGFKNESYRIVRDMRNSGVTPDAATWRILDKLRA